MCLETAENSRTPFLSAGVRSRDDDSIALFAFSLETSLPTSDVIIYFTVPNGEMRVARGNNYLLLISVILTEIVRAK